MFEGKTCITLDKKKIEMIDFTQYLAELLTEIEVNQRMVQEIMKNTCDKQEMEIGEFQFLL